LPSSIVTLYVQWNEAEPVWQVLAPPPHLDAFGLSQSDQHGTADATHPLLKAVFGPNGPALSRIHFETVKLDAAVTALLCGAIRQRLIHSLRSLVIENTAAEAAEFDAIAGALDGSRCLETLCLNANRDRQDRDPIDYPVDAVTWLMTGNTSITSLKVWGSDDTQPSPLTGLVDAILSNPRSALTDLTVCNSCISPTGSLALARLVTAPLLRDLSFRIDDAAVMAVAGYLPQRRTPLRLTIHPVSETKTSDWIRLGPQAMEALLAARKHPLISVCTLSVCDRNDARCALVDWKLLWVRTRTHRHACNTQQGNRLQS
jgi:hypothetical protein